MPQQFDDTKPLSFELPDGDVANVITWAFVIKKLNTELQPTIEQLGMINSSLTRINARVDYWLEQQQG
jgi:hypothetical protein